MVISMEERFAYYDPECDIAWIPTGPAASVVCEEKAWGLVDHNRETGEVTGLEIWDASRFFPADMLEQLPAPGRPGAAAA